MADRSFLQNHGALEVGVVDLFCSITVGSTGAVSASAGKGTTSITRNSAGKYTILLQDTYNDLLWADVKVLSATGSDPATIAVAGRVFSQAVATAAAPTVIIQGYAYDDGAAADFGVGAKLLVKLTLKNSSVA